jgi:NTE family protein
LAKPVDYGARHGAGNDRALVLGGGGIFFIAWQAGYLDGLRRRGVDVANAEIVVGTSAGAVVASVLSAAGSRPSPPHCARACVWCWA